MIDTFEHLVADIKACTLCHEHLPLGPRPVIQVDPAATILVVGQAPGARVHETGIPFNDPSGDRLRKWMGVSRDEFYDSKKIALIPMGFCYPGTGKSGDLPPRPECRKTWRKPLLEQLSKVQLTLVLGQYAQAYHLPEAKGSLTDRVRNWQHHWPEKLPLPHPSPRNNRWLKTNPWFERDVIPVLQQRVSKLIG